MSPLRRLLEYFRPYRGRAAAALLAMGIVSLSTVLLLFLLTKIIDDVLGAGTASSIRGFGEAPAKTAVFVRWLDSIYSGARAAAEASGIPIRFAVPILLLAALVSKNVFSYFSEFEFNGIGLSMVRDLRRDAYGRLLGQSAAFYSRSTTGDLLARLLSDVELIQSAFGTRLADFVQGAVTILLVLFYVVSLNARLSLFVLLLAPVLLLPII
jgi:ABC-type multidrug transport system fused ATPase/permease subunit